MNRQIYPICYKYRSYDKDIQNVIKPYLPQVLCKDIKRFIRLTRKNKLFK